MGIFSFLKKNSMLRCDWCKREMENPSYIKHVGTKTYSFCSASCKKAFRKVGLGKQRPSCPTCALKR